MKMRPFLALFNHCDTCHAHSHYNHDVVYSRQSLFSSFLLEQWSYTVVENHTKKSQDSRKLILKNLVEIFQKSATFLNRLKNDILTHCVISTQQYFVHTQKVPHKKFSLSLGKLLLDMVHGFLESFLIPVQQENLYIHSSTHNLPSLFTYLEAQNMPFTGIITWSLWPAS